VVLAGAALRPLFKALWLGAALTGAAGICFVLMSATGNLEAKQAERHSGDATYAAWLAGSWAGPVLRKAPPATLEQDESAPDG